MPFMEVEEKTLHISLTDIPCEYIYASMVTPDNYMFFQVEPGQMGLDFIREVVAERNCLSSSVRDVRVRTTSDIPIIGCESFYADGGQSCIVDPDNEDTELCILDVMKEGYEYTGAINSSVSVIYHIELGVIYITSIDIVNGNISPDVPVKLVGN